MAKADEKLRRRTQRRQQFTASALVFEPKSETLLRARTADLGPDGCFIDTLNPLAAGTQVKVRIEKAGVSFEAWAKVIYALDSMGMGLAFHSVGPEQLWVLQEWLGEEGGSLLPEIKLPPIETEMHAESVAAEAQGKDTQCEAALAELVIELMAHGLVSEEKGNSILRKLSQPSGSE